MHPPVFPAERIDEASDEAVVAARQRLDRALHMLRKEPPGAEHSYRASLYRRIVAVTARVDQPGDDGPAGAVAAAHQLAEEVERRLTIR